MEPLSAAPVSDTTVPAAQPLLRRLGRYSLTGTLGEGTMGVVHRAIDPHSGRVVAIKTLRESMGNTPNGNHAAALRFGDAAQAAGRLSHPGIVAIHEYGQDGGQGFIVTEYVEGVSLLRCTTPRQRLPLADVLSVGAQLLQALRHAHAHGVLHRDIKPSNLLVTRGGQLKITDFGIADAAVLRQGATALGSCGYMAPECDQDIELDWRVDLFACGVLLYELLTGQRPFKGLPAAVTDPLLYQEPPPVNAVCAAAEAAALAPFAPLVARSIARDRSRRYPDAQAMLDDLTSAAGAPVAARLSATAVQRLMAAPQTPTAAPLTPTRWPAPSGVASSAVVTHQPGHGDVDPAQLGTLVSLLATTLGPVARVVVRRAAAHSPCLADVVHRVATALPTADARRGFLEQARRRLGAAATPGLRPPSAAPRPPMSAPVSSPLREEAVLRAQAALARHFGPIARVMVKRARANADDRERFIAALTDLAAHSTDPLRLRAELEASV